MQQPKPKPRRYPLRPWVTPDALPAHPRPNLPGIDLPFNTIGPASRVPQAGAHPVRDAFIGLPPAILKGAAEAPFSIAREIANAKTPDEVIHAITGVGLSMDPNSPAARPSDARGGRLGQAAALGLMALPEIRPLRAMQAEERAVMKAVRNARDYALRHEAPLKPPIVVPTPDAPRFPGPMTAGPAERESMYRIQQALTEPVVGPSRVPPGTMLGETAPERITSAAVKGADGNYYTGVNHGDAWEKAAEALRSTPEGMKIMQQNGGSAIERGGDNFFRTSTGRYIDRKEAASLARTQGQTNLAPEWGGLHSSDLPREAPAIIPSSPIRKLRDALLQDESALITKRTLPAFEAAGETLPKPEVFGAGAIAGAAKMGWYANFARALSETFGPEAPRFAALLSSLSPQRSVETNLNAALDLWNVWNSSGRPSDPKVLTNLMHDVARRNEGGGELPARIPNAIRALTTENPADIALSGPKVSAFHRNLIGDTQRVTLDTWMQKLGGLGPGSLSRTVRGTSQASPTGLAYAGRVRQTADYLSRATGHKWSPAEVQETLWSWGKALDQTAGAGSLTDAIPNVTRDQIRGVPDFASLMNEQPALGSIESQGLKPPIASSTIPPALPDPERSFLEVLARNMQSVRNERGALGGPRTLLRVENEKGVGPYQAGGLASGWIGADPTILDRQPLMRAPEWTNMGSTQRAEHKFGFRDIAQLRRWFTPDEIQRLSEGGFRVQPYEVPHHIYDETQTVFDPRIATRATATPLKPSYDPMIPSLNEGNAALPMLGLSGGAALGGLSLWELLKNRR